MRAKSSEGFPRPILPVAMYTAFAQWMIRPINNGPMAVSEFRGKVVFLNLWSVSCAPCIGEMPGIEKLQESLRGDPVVFLAVTRDGEKDIRSFLEKHPMRVPVYLTERDTPEYLWGSGVPVTLILDTGGKSVYSTVGAMNWDDDEARKFIRKLEKQ